MNRELKPETKRRIYEKLYAFTGPWPPMPRLRLTRDDVLARRDELPGMPTWRHNQSKKPAE